MSADTRSFGAWLLLGVDALFYGGLLYICAFRRTTMEHWPDAEPLAIWLPLAAVFVLAVAALAVRASWPLAQIATWTAAVLAVLSVAQAHARGLGAHTKYGLFFYTLVGTWTLHVVGGAVAVVLTRGPLVRRYLAVQVVAGVAVLLVVWS